MSGVLKIWFILYGKSPCFAAISVCLVYAFFQFPNFECLDLIVEPTDDGIFVVNKAAGTITFCYKGGSDAEISPVCKGGPRVPKH